MPKAWDFRLLGDAQLQATVASLPLVLQGKVMRPALRAGAHWVAARARAGAATLPGATGRLGGARWKVRALARSRTRTGYQVISPTRDALKIDPKNEYYYPAAVELGRLSGRRVLSGLHPARSALTRSTQRDIEAESRRHIPGRHFFLSALKDNPGALMAAMAAEARARLAALRPSSGTGFDLGSIDVEVS